MVLRSALMLAVITLFTVLTAGLSFLGYLIDPAALIAVGSAAATAAVVFAGSALAALGGCGHFVTVSRACIPAS